MILCAKYTAYSDEGVGVIEGSGRGEGKATK